MRQSLKAKLKPEQRHGNRMEQVWEEFINQVSQKEPVKRLQAMIFQGRERGQDTSGYETELKQFLDELTPAALSVATGQPLNEQQTRAIAGLNQSAMTSLIGQAATTTRAERQIEEVAKPGLELEEERLGVRRDELSMYQGFFSDCDKIQRRYLTRVKGVLKINSKSDI